VSSDDPDTYKFNLVFGGNGTHWNVCDFNIDLSVNLQDLAVLAEQWCSTPGTPSPDVAPADEPDGVINLLDFAVFAQ